MKKIILLNLLICLVIISKSQNLILNGDFETYSSCPTNLDEVYKANNWVSIVNSPDYYNCNFLQHSAFPQTVTGAFSGTGFMDFASYGDPNGSAEAIAQSFQQPLLPGNNYTVKLAAKKANSGGWSSVCGGVAVYGIKGTLPAPVSSIHASQVTGSALLGVSPTISSDLWQTFTFNIIVADTVNHLVFTVELVPGCTECIFLDSTALYITPNAITELSNENFFNVCPNPVKNEFQVSGFLFGEKTELSIYDMMGKEVLKSIINNQQSIINIQSLNSGIYFIEISAGKNNYRKKILKE
ncbi:MAG TPA: T9SS type A sorting domain-containing protein [Bacteroidia bacterium]|nr:T9SS type A sorting domain-containing protein [Bacteroidia bacterium]